MTCNQENGVFVVSYVKIVLLFYTYHLASKFRDIQSSLHQDDLQTYFSARSCYTASGCRP